MNKKDKAKIEQLKGMGIDCEFILSGWKIGEVWLRPEQLRKYSVEEIVRMIEKSKFFMGKV